MEVKQQKIVAFGSKYRNEFLRNPPCNPLLTIPQLPFLLQHEISSPFLSHIINSAFSHHMGKPFPKPPLECLSANERNLQNYEFSNNMNFSPPTSRNFIFQRTCFFAGNFRWICGSPHRFDGGI
ncbi:MAG: hypothetical protein D6732_01325 [Methanobacteriota archaeon]|nr:MAG: hypothetical protein D6732_01325 [Euryarchaeota archaeon]